MQTTLGRDFSSRLLRQIVWDQQLISVIPLDDLNLAPDIIKIDTKGFDFEAIRRLRATIEKHRPHILKEFTPEHMGDSEEFFDQLGYSLFTYDEVCEGFVAFDHERETRNWRTKALQVNLVCIPREKVAHLPLLQDRRRDATRAAPPRRLAQRNLPGTGPSLSKSSGTTRSAQNPQSALLDCGCRGKSMVLQHRGGW